MQQPGNFQPGTQYTAEVILTPAPGYYFSGSIEVKHTGATPSTQSFTADADGAWKNTFTFPPTAAATKVNDLDLTYRIPQPQAGNTAVFSFEASQYTGSVEWNQGLTSNGNKSFQLGTAYTATVTLKAKPGFTFTGITANDFFHNGASTVSLTGSGDSERIVIVFPAANVGTKVTDLNLTSRIPVPEAGNTALTTFSSLQYVANITWKDTTTAGVPGKLLTGGGKFVNDAVYKATVTLDAKPGFTFKGVTQGNVTYGSSVSSFAFSANDNKCILTILFAKTAPGATVSDFDLTYRIPQPQAGNTAVISFEASQYTGSVVWTGTLSNGKSFQLGTAYAARVTLKAKPGFTFTGITPTTNDFFHNGASTVSLSGSGDSVRTVTIQFPAAAAATKVSDFDLTYRIPQPQAGNTAVSSFEASQYRAAVEWSPSLLANGRFDPSKTTYTATVKLEAKAGYTFKASGNSVVFFHNGGGTISKTVLPNGPDGKWYEDSIRVTIAFSLASVSAFTGTGSVLDLIQQASVQKKNELFVKLEAQGAPEQVQLTQGSLGTTGLVLNNTTSPPQVTIDGNGGTVDLIGTTAKGSLITVGSGATLTLRNITFDGLKGATETSSNKAALITVANGGTLILENGAKIQNNKNTTGSGGGVYVAGTLTLKDGIISGNQSHILGGGVSVYGGTFTMSGGSISGNKAVVGGGVYVDSVYVAGHAGIFKKTGSSIIYGKDATQSLKNTSTRGGMRSISVPRLTRSHPKNVTVRQIRV
jgi:hypothetical protein